MQILKLKLFQHSAKRAWLPPGTPVHTGLQQVEKTRIVRLTYNESEALEKQCDDITECAADKEKVNFIGIAGLHDTKLLEEIGARFGLHHLAMEDVAHTEHRTKVELFDDYLFIILKALKYNGDAHEVRMEHVAVFLKEETVLLFQESDEDLFSKLRDRIKNGRGRIRRMKADYLVHGILDHTVDDYFLVLEKIGDELEALDERMMGKTGGRSALDEIYRLKKLLMVLRRTIWPLREAVSMLLHDDDAFISDSVKTYMRDLNDHVVQIIETIEIYRDMVSSMLDVHLTSASNRMNEVMKVLTIISTIFIPLTFIVGVYGMNFKHMPELDKTWAYPTVMGVMMVAAITMLAFFKKKNWF